MVKGVSITYMEEVSVDGKYSMEVTCHMDPISYGKLIY